MGYRLAVVQHGDYVEALKIIAGNRPEPYTGMYYSVEALEKLCRGTTHRVISLDAPPYHVEREGGDLVGFSAPKWKKVDKIGWAYRAYTAVKAFRPTHLLLRTGGEIALPVLRYAVPRGVDTLAVLAGYVSNAGVRQRLMNRWLVPLYNAPSVRLVANHRKPAADSLVAAGVNPDKVVAYDNPAKTHPSQFPARAAPPPGIPLVAFAGVMAPGKGIGDLLDAVVALNRSGYPIRLTAVGEGPSLPDLRDRARALADGLVSFPGRVANQEVFDLVRGATVACVASRKESSEGLPYVVTEVLSARTPLVCSDHPCLTDVLHDGEGVRFFPSGDVPALARVLREVCDDPASYARLSETTAAAFARIECPTLFHELLERWRESWAEPRPTQPGSPEASLVC